MKMWPDSPLSGLKMSFVLQGQACRLVLFVSDLNFNLHLMFRFLTEYLETNPRPLEEVLLLSSQVLVRVLQQSYYQILIQMEEGAEIEIKTNALLQAHTLEPANRPQARPQEQEEPDMVGFLSLFRFATNIDLLLMGLGSLGAVLVGVALPMFVVLWGSITNNYGSSNLEEQAKSTMLTFFQIGAGAFTAGWSMVGFWIITGQRQSIACRKEYLKSLLRQEIGWFDTINQSELATKFGTDCFAFQGAIGEKVSTLIMVISMFVTGFVIAFIYGWLMTLVVILALPVIAFGGYLFMKASASKDLEQQSDYSEAGGQVEQAVAAIKTVKQLNGEQFEAGNYAQTLKAVTNNSIKYGAYLGVGIGTLFFALNSSYSLGFWYGSHCVEGSEICPSHLNGGSVYSAGDVLVIFFSVFMAGFYLSQLSPSMKKISEGRVAANRIFKIIDREPLIRSREGCLVPAEFKGVFRFQRVTFAYPKDRSRNILDQFDLEISSKFSAVVGQSGCGKSTIFQLLMRFYDPDEGRILLDGVDLRDLDLNWLRSQIGYVGQEPVLFATTIKENLLFGKENASEEDIWEALRKAEALDFVDRLKDKLETYVGMGGGQMSGGQKQRLGIARALLKNPKILLLDEATSALDRRNQKLIQGTLNKIAEDKITITIAHRVKTIKNCQQIIVMQAGKVLEQGKFRELKRFADLNIEEETEELEKEQIPRESLQHRGVEGGAEDEEEKKAKEENELLQRYEDNIFGRLFAYASDNKILFFWGLGACVINGLIFPIFSIFLSKMLAVLVKFSVDPVQARIDANLYALIFFILAIVAFVVNCVQFIIFTYIGENMTEKIRNQTYLKILKMPVPWFDRPKNASGSLSNRLASDCHSINELITTFIPILLQSATTLIAGIVIAFLYEWRTALVALGLMPLLILSGAIEMSFSEGFSDKTDRVYKESSNLIMESMNSIRTVTSFGSEDIIERKYSARLDDPLGEGMKKGLVSGFLFGLNQLIMFYVFGIIFYLGIVFMSHNNLSIADVFTAIYGITFSGMTAGNNSHFMPDVAAAKKSAASVFQIQDSVDEDQLQEKEQSKMLRTPLKGHIQIKDVSFKYESRDQNVFSGLNLEIRQGQSVGFVGPSGCGKSTVHQLLQRFYDPTQGSILIDGINIKDYDIHHLRDSLGVVSQEPVLFNQTIGNNIKYNKTGATRQLIVAAANAANFNPEQEDIQAAQHYIGPANPESKSKPDALPKEKKKLDGTGFDKNVGVKGSHISGGQKQRIAIARAILRQPMLLLLDEATSALDSSNEKKVQDSLDRMMAGKTSITIAHRIDTIRNSNLIMVFYHGNVSEIGTYSELMERRGHFYKLEKGLQLL